MIKNSGAAWLSIFLLMFCLGCKSFLVGDRGEVIYVECRVVDIDGSPISSARIINPPSVYVSSLGMLCPFSDTWLELCRLPVYSLHANSNGIIKGKLKTIKSGRYAPFIIAPGKMPVVFAGQQRVVLAEWRKLTLVRPSDNGNSEPLPLFYDWSWDFKFHNIRYGTGQAIPYDAMKPLKAVDEFARTYLVERIHLNENAARMVNEIDGRMIDEPGHESDCFLTALTHNLQDWFPLDSLQNARGVMGAEDTDGRRRSIKTAAPQGK